MVDLSVLNDGGSQYISFGSRDKCWFVDGVSCQLTKILIDPQSLRTGWGKIEKGTAPHFAWAEVAGTTIPKPSEDHLPAFGVFVYVATEHGASTTGWREWNTTQATARHVLINLWPNIESQAAQNPGCAAVISVNGTHDHTSKGGQINAAPTLELLGWVPSPATVNMNGNANGAAGDVHVPQPVAPQPVAPQPAIPTQPQEPVPSPNGNNLF